MRAVRALIPGRLRGLRTNLGYYVGPRLASELRKRWVIFRNPQATIRFGEHTYVGPGFSLHMPFGGTFIVGDAVEFRRGFRAELGSEARIEIGDGSYLTYDVILACTTSIHIGERCGLGQGTFIADGNHRYRDLTKPFREQGYKLRPITIEDDVQIHSKSTIVNNIGTRAIIGANTVVTNPVPAYCLSGGVPARVLDYFGPPGSEPEGWSPDGDATADPPATGADAGDGSG